MINDPFVTLMWKLISFPWKYHFIRCGRSLAIDSVNVNITPFAATRVSIHKRKLSPSLPLSLTFCAEESFSSLMMSARSLMMLFSLFSVSLSLSLLFYSLLCSMYHQHLFFIFTRPPWDWRTLFSSTFAHTDTLALRHDTDVRRTRDERRQGKSK